MPPHRTTPNLETVLKVKQYDLAATLSSGQAFRWFLTPSGWEGVVKGRWIRLRQTSDRAIKATLAVPVTDWSWLGEYLQSKMDLKAVLSSFPPDDSALNASIQACQGLRLLRQDPWECLASFILSSNKQIVQIQQIIDLLCQRHGQSVTVPPGHAPASAFPSPAQLSQLSETELRDCKMGYRAPNLLRTSRMVADGTIDLRLVERLPLAEARQELIRCPGIGPKIADCILLFAYNFPNAFPVDVWVRKALHQLYFPKRRPTQKRLERFINTHFGPHSGYAQQYLFHYIRTQGNISPG